MFSANENIALRQHKRRIIQYVEECIPENVLDEGTMVMVMQVSCKAPGCVPLETAIMVVFPSSEEELLPGVKESCNGGTYKTKVLKPMSEVVKHDVLEALPTGFIGGLRSTERLCYQARDVMLAQITQLMGDDDAEGRKLMAEYLQECLNDYIQRDCVPPEYGEPFPPLESSEAAPGKEEDVTTNDKETATTAKQKITPPSGNFVFRRAADDDDMTFSPTTSTNPAAGGTTSLTVNGAGSAPSSTVAATSSSTSTSSNMNGGSADKKPPSSMDWRRQQNVEKSLQQQSIIERLAQREHAPGVRMAGCPCCDPDNPSNYVDSMMML